MNDLIPAMLGLLLKSRSIETTFSEGRLRHTRRQIVRGLQVLNQELIILMAVGSVKLHFGIGWRGRISLCFSVHELASLVKDQCVALIAHLLVSSTMLAALGALPVWLLQNHEYAVIVCLCILKLLFQIHLLACELLIAASHLEIGALGHLGRLNHWVAGLDARLLDLSLLPGGLADSHVLASGVGDLTLREDDMLPLSGIMLELCNLQGCVLLRLGFAVALALRLLLAWSGCCLADQTAELIQLEVLSIVSPLCPAFRASLRGWWLLTGRRFCDGVGALYQ